ncbi:hypothetical protein HQ325_02020 [Rhodococcus sp. BP-349]|uniref:hypothetical protein n=1 Tax=unclassified Rhodococcus (in: high G+C Gram-positive bacteria) TaxID=192944 RepID=UPI001C9A8EFA|nr:MULTISPECIES: hypothetical protein [unclassified Rhodococcus (in: high G+C Gram-positive bacteria)]MBY6537439.1 hypothetical protein [Rhodococcus sp. BP-363]MBY6541776.1 hypothetical protein [Rhodococcus sp. BP-369]MBY6561006.1 hypothetical protein [Rhodococcus sp. BP-370]MBY6575298.1 hypothetical protein [Rhodococcus sp. BP-364]MBY6584599.1 hypothetical protein [Rhodococcus sp. BP-358]
MIAVVVVGVVWMLIAAGAAVLLGRAASRADHEELGSEFHWDMAELDHEVFGSR